MARPSKPWYWEARNCWATNLNGKRYTAPRNVVTQHDAWAWHRGLMESSAPVIVGAMQVHELAEKYLSWDQRRVRVGQRNEAAHHTSAGKLTRVCATVISGVQVGEMLVTQITSRVLKQAIMEWQSEGLSANYVKDLGAILKSVFRWAEHEELIVTYPFTKTPLPRVPRTAARYATRLEAAQWLRFLWRRGLREFAFLQRCLVHTGARPAN